MTNLSVFFQFEDHDIRIVGTADQPEWVAQDVCTILGIAEAKSSLRDFDDDEKGMHSVHLRSENGVEQGREMLTLKEPGLYRLIFKSRKEVAKRFQRWISHEVIPSIRKTGTYSINPPIEQTAPTSAMLEQLQQVQRVLDLWKQAKDICSPEQAFSIDQRFIHWLPDVPPSISPPPISPPSPPSRHSDQFAQTLNAELSILERCHQLGYQPEDMQLLNIGKKAAQLYRLRFQINPPKEERHIKNGWRLVNVYRRSDISIVDSAIEAIMKGVKA